LCSVIVVSASFPNAYSLQGAGSSTAYSSAAGSQLEGETPSLIMISSCLITSSHNGRWY